MAAAVVTGACGRIGRGIAAALRARSHHVTGIDALPAPSGWIGTAGDEFFQVDLAAAANRSSESYTTLRQAVAGAGVVVHCAAWPGPSATPPPAVEACAEAVAPSIGLEDASPATLLVDNVASTAATCDAAVAAGATRFVFSSSAFAMGYSHAVTGPRAYRPRYLPVDEEHGALPHETYGLSKLVGEQVLEAAARTAIEASFVSLRFTNIVKRELWGTLPWPAPDDASPLTLLLWAYCHEDDVIAAHVAAATMDEAAAPGTHEPYIIAAPDTRFREPTLPLLASHLGLDHVPLAAPLAGNASVLSARKAERRLGLTFRSWQEKRSASRGRRMPAPALPRWTAEAAVWLAGRAPRARRPPPEAL